MNVSDASEHDARQLARALTLLHGSDYSMSGKDLCSAADAIRWVQDLAQKMVKAMAKASEKPAGELVAAAPAASSSPEPEGGLKIKAFHPGKPSKK